MGTLHNVVKQSNVPPWMGMLGVAMWALFNGFAFGRASVLTIVCSTYSLSVVLPSLDCDAGGVVGYTICWLAVFGCLVLSTIVVDSAMVGLLYCGEWEC